MPPDAARPILLTYAVLTYRDVSRRETPMTLASLCLIVQSLPDHRHPRHLLSSDASANARQRRDNCAKPAPQGAFAAFHR
jgi:hypothetical protein